MKKMIRSSLWVPFLGALCLGSCLLPPPAPAQPAASPQDDGRSLFDKAQQYFKEKDYQKAKDALNQVVAKHPLEDFIPRARLLLANLQEDFTVSTAQFKELAAEYSGREEGQEAQKNLGARYYLADKYQDAAESYKEFIDQYPKSASMPEIRYWYASSLLALDKDNDAVDQYRKVLEGSPDNPWAPKALLGIGNAYFKMKKYNDAEKQYLRILDQYHFYDELNLVYLKLAQAYAAEKKYKEAHAAYQTLLSDYPKSLEVADARDQMQALEKEHPDLPRTVEAESTPTPEAAPPAQPTATPPAAVEAEEDQPSKPFHVQVGVYSKKLNVDKARKAVQKAGYVPYVVTARQEGVPYTYYKVRVGSFADRASAEKVARELARKTREKAIVVEE